MRAIRFLSLAAALIVLISAVCFLLEFVIDSPPVRNDRSLGFTGFLLLLPVILALAWLHPSRLLACSVGLMMGGALANTLVRNAVGPVADYIPSPLFPDMYFNLADLAIVSGVVFGFAVAVSLFLPHKETSEKDTPENAHF